MMSKLTEEHYSYLLIHTGNTTSKMLLRLKKRLGSYKSVAHSSYLELLQNGLTERQAQSIVRQRSDVRLIARIEDAIARKNIRVVLKDDAGYPELLRLIEDPPAAIYIRGALEESMRLSIVGSRKASRYALDIVYEAAAVMAKLGVAIVSGLAYGIDKSAHEGALKGRGATLAVLGSGVDQIYPAAHTGLAEQIIATGGAIVSEFPILSTPFKGNFPIRNRVIAGLSKTLLVGECDLESGAMITAARAMDYHREVWSVPGDITRQTNQGSNTLFYRGATPFISINDLVAHYGIRLEEPVKKVDLTIEEKKIQQKFTFEGIHLDKVAEALRLDIGDLSSKVIMLELKGVIRHEGAGIYRRII